MVGDDLLDFNLDGEAEEDYDLKTPYSSSSSLTAAATAAFGDESLRGSFPVSFIPRVCSVVSELTRTSWLVETVNFQVYEYAPRRTFTLEFY